jgi:hypothetical protein
MAAPRFIPATGQNWRHAVRQYRDDRDLRAPLFEFKKRSLVHFAADPDEVHMTTRLSGEKTHFFLSTEGVIQDRSFAGQAIRSTIPVIGPATSGRTFSRHVPVGPESDLGSWKSEFEGPCRGFFFVQPAFRLTPRQNPCPSCKV